MKNNKDSQQVSVVGGGISGLTIAYYLVQFGFQVTIYEKEKRLGGLLGTSQVPTGLVESAANAFMATKELEDISAAINIPLLSKKKAARKRYIFRDGKARRWPLSFGETLRILPFLFKYLFFKSKLTPLPKESLSSWGDRNLGKAASEFLLGPAMQGVYGAQPVDLSASLLLGEVFLDSQSIATGNLRGSVAPMGGMEAWIQGMSLFLKEKGCRFVEASKAPEENPSHPVVVATDLKSAYPWLHKLGLPTNTLTSVTLSSVTLHLAANSSQPLPGFGCLFPKKENFHSLGVLFNHNIFENRVNKGLSETWIFDRVSEPRETSSDVFRDWVLKDRKRLCGGRAHVDFLQVTQWPGAIPLYNPELETWLKEFPGNKENIFFVGNYLGQIGLSKILTLANRIAQQVKDHGQWHAMES